MPFTLAHPAAILPFRKTRLPLSALIIGTMVPDFGYLTQLTYFISHTIIGIFSYCIPVGVAVYFFFHYFLKYPFLDLFPDKHSSFLGGFVKSPSVNSFSKFFFLVVAIALGVATHLTWDSITHIDGWFVQHVAWFNTLLIDNDYFQLRVCRFFQHLSTVSGGALLLFYYFKSLKNRPKQIVAIEHLLKPGTRIAVIMAITVIGANIAVMLEYSSLRNIHNYFSFRNIIYNFVVTAITIYFPMIIFYSLVWNVTKLFKNIRRRYAHNG